MEKIKINSKLFLDTVRTLYFLRETKLKLISECYQSIKNKTKEISMFLETDYRKDSQVIIIKNAKDIASLSAKILKAESQIRDMEEIIIEILELCVADCKISFSTQNKINSIGEFFDNQDEINLSMDHSFDDTSVSLEELLSVKKVKDLFGIGDNDVNVRF